MMLAASGGMPQARAVAWYELEQLRNRLGSDAQQDAAETASRHLLAADITRFLERPGEALKTHALPTLPPGAPIGEGGEWWVPPDEAEGNIWWQQIKDEGSMDELDQR